MKNIYRIQAYDSTIWGYFCIEFIDFTSKGKSWLDYRNLFSANDYEKNDKIILKYLQQMKGRKNYIALFTVSIENLKKLKISYVLEKTLVLSVICSKFKNEDETLFKEEESIEMLKFLGLIKNMQLF